MGVNTHTGPSNVNVYVNSTMNRLWLNTPAAGDFTPTGLLPFSFQTSLISAEPGPLDPLRVFRSKFSSVTT